MEHFGINTQENYSNSYLVALFSNGQMMQCEDGVKFQCWSPKLFRIPENCTLNIFTQKVLITHIIYLRPMKIVNNRLIHDMAQIKTDIDVAQMINRWKEVQRLDLSVARPDTLQYIELFILATKK